MNDIMKFLKVHYKNALKLVSDFDITKNHKWDSKDYLNELYVQIGHVFNVLYADEKVNETKRNINNLGDELSDVLLQLINLSKNLQINMFEIEELKDFNYSDLNGVMILLGQLTETLMENNECRFKKDRVGFYTSYDFIKDRLFKLFIVVFEISKKYKLDMIKEFDAMLKDANKFLKKFRSCAGTQKEYIDIYDNNEKLLGYCKKEKAHELGYWHKVFGCIIYNNKKNTVILQIKNPHHNKIHKKPLLEITAGGHLISGETLECGIREIKEETGLDIQYDELVFLEKRKCNINLRKNYKIKEFQYYYAVNKNIDIKSFKNFDKNEVLGFLEVKINALIDLIDKKKDFISATNNDGEKVKISIKSLDSAYIKNGLFKSLLLKINCTSTLKINVKIYRINQYMKKQIRRFPEKFEFDDGKVCQIKEWKKEGIKFAVMLVNTDRNKNDYITYILLIKKHIMIPHLFLKHFNNENGAENYYNDLNYFVEKSNKNMILKNIILYFEKNHFIKL